MPTKLRLYADYSDWPIWGPEGGPLGEGDLPLSDSLKARIKAWFNSYDQPRPEWPIWVPPAGTTDPDQAWVDEGAAIAGLLAAELGSDFQVAYEN